MGQLQVRALQVCFVGGSLRKVGDVYLVPDGTPLRTKGMPPVMELVADLTAGPPVKKASKKAAKKKAAKKKAAEPVETTETAED